VRTAVGPGPGPAQVPVVASTSESSRGLLGTLCRRTFMRWPPAGLTDGNPRARVRMSPNGPALCSASCADISTESGRIASVQAEVWFRLSKQIICDCAAVPIKGDLHRRQIRRLAHPRLVAASPAQFGASASRPQLPRVVRALRSLRKNDSCGGCRSCRSRARTPRAHPNRGGCATRSRRRWVGERTRGIHSRQEAHVSDRCGRSHPAMPRYQLENVPGPG